MSLRELLTVNKVRISGAVLLAAAGALAFGACGDDDGDFENCGNGITCPAPLICAARQAKCLETACGDGIVGTYKDGEGNEIFEECDDGNVLDYDGCSADCRIETCGDGIVQRQRITYDDRGTAISIEPGEICDWGEEGVGPENCLAEDVKDAEGNVLIAACRSNLKCGNGVVDPGEICDHGNGLDSVGNWAGNVSSGSFDCSKDCGSDNSCGNGILDNDPTSIVGRTLEECDVGNADKELLPVFPVGTHETAKCIEGCVIQLCGDGKVTGDEQCDPGTVGGTTAICNSDCTLGQCGDGRVNMLAGEECDTGDSNDANQWAVEETTGQKTWKGTATCTNICKKNICGDDFYVTDSAGQPVANSDGVKEECDDGKRGSDFCTRECKANICGDLFIGKIRTVDAEGLESIFTEECDDGPTGSRTCTAQCTRSSCGDGIVNAVALEECDPGEAVAKGEDGNWANCNYDCTTPKCGDGILNASAGEECDHNLGEGSAVGNRLCNFDCTASKCGDGKINAKADEYCDPGDASRDANDPIGNWAVCNYDCTNVFCGDKLVNKAAGEECDPGTGIGQSDSWQAQAPSVRCNIDCTNSRCGDGKVNAVAGEECDPGESGDWSGCSRETCTLVRSSGAR